VLANQISLKNHSNVRKKRFEAKLTTPIAANENLLLLKYEVKKTN